MAKTEAVPYYVTGIEAYAKIGDVQFPRPVTAQDTWVVDSVVDVADITTLDFAYAIDQIPTFTATMTVGQDARVRTRKIAEAHEAARRIDFYLGIEIYAKFTSKDGIAGPRGEKLPGVGEWVRVFFGYITAVAEGTDRASGSTSLVLSGLHWLADLTSSQTQIRNWVGYGGDDFASGVDAVFNFINKNYHAATAHSALEPVFAAGGADLDFWRDSMKKALNAIASDDSSRIQYAQMGLEGLSPSNSGAAGALDRMDRGVFAAGDASSYPLNMLNLDTHGYIAEWISTTMGSEMSKVWAGGNVWSVIQYFKDMLFYNVVPLVNTAGVVPITLNLATDSNKGIPYKGIYSDEFVVTRANTQLQWPVRGVVVVAGDSMYTSDYKGGDVVFPTAWGFADIYEKVSNSSKLSGGAYEFIPAPVWVDSDMVSISETLLGEGVGGVQQANEASNPVSQKDPPNKDPDEDKSKRYDAVKSLFGDRIAHDRLLHQLFIGRTMSVTGRLRWDIAPGSFVGLQILGQPGYNDQLQFGTVYRARISMSTAGPRASTSLDLVSMANESEHEQESLTSTEHPLYGKAWVGCPLLNEDGT